MAYCIELVDQQTRIPTEGGATVLEAALAAGLPFAHSCRAGNCGTCKCELLDGEVLELPYSEFALSAEERGRGLVLACRTQVWGDCAVRALNSDDLAWHPLRQLRCRVQSNEALTHDIRRLRLDVVAGGPFLFSPGQYARLEFAPGLARDYSMANLPEAAQLEFHVRLAPRGAASGFVAGRLREGDEVRIEGPLGSSHLRERDPGPILAVAGGSGLAPILCIVESALRRAMTQPIHLYFGVRGERDLYCEDRLAALQARFGSFEHHIVLSEPAPDSRRRRGLIGDAVAADFKALDGFKAYLAGPPVMVEASTRMLLARGLPQRDIHADAFYTEAERASMAGA